jgi:choloylglycine hydrolase
MCTAIVYRKKSAYMGRNLDLDYSFGEKVVLTPKGYQFPLKCGVNYHTQNSMIGMATLAGTYPLYAEAVNDKGVAMAGLNFPGLAVYQESKNGMHNITPFEIIPWLLGQVSSVREAEGLLQETNLLDVPFSVNMPLAPLHFFLSDAERSIVAEPMPEGLRIFKDPFDVMTNNPPFDYHLWNVKQYRRLAISNGEALFSQKRKDSLSAYAEGMGAVGMPGDFSSTSRFIRAAFLLANAKSADQEEENVTQTFHILDAVAMPRGAVRTAQGRMDITRYSCCMNLSDGSYYYKTYENSQITKISLTQDRISSGKLSVWPLRIKQNIYRET